MKVFVIVNETPWGSSLASAALRFVRAALRQGLEVPAVFFSGDGVYHALPGRMSDSGQEKPAEAWMTLAGQEIELLLCSSAAARRLDGIPAETASAFREAGLARMWALASDCDRVVNF